MLKIKDALYPALAAMLAGLVVAGGCSSDSADEEGPESQRQHDSGDDGHDNGQDNGHQNGDDNGHDNGEPEVDLSGIEPGSIEDGFDHCSGPDEEIEIGTDMYRHVLPLDDSVSGYVVVDGPHSRTGVWARRWVRDPDSGGRGVALAYADYIGERPETLDELSQQFSRTDPSSGTEAPADADPLVIVYVVVDDFFFGASAWDEALARETLAAFQPLSEACAHQAAAHDYIPD